MRINLFYILFSVTAASSSIALGQIINTTGAVVVAIPPSDISSNQWESNTQIRAFAEQQNVLLTQDITADITVPGTSPSATDSNLSPGIIPAGTLVNSYTVHYDVVGQRDTNNALEASGSITFGSAILGLFVLSDSENATNSILGLPGITYSNGADHGLTFDPAGGGTSDIVTLSSDRRTLSLDLRNASFADDVRVVTAVPEPGAAWMAVCGTAILLQGRRFRPVAD